MFGKLMKYDNRKLSKYMFPLFAAATIASVVMSLMLFLMINMGDSSEEFGFTVLLMMGMVMVMFVAYMVIIAAYSGSYILIGVRFYKNLISDEGYLTFTLPVTAGQILNSKILSAFIWRILSGLVLILNIVIVFLGVLPSALEEILADNYIRLFFDAFFEEINATIGMGQFVGLIISIVLFAIVMEMLSLGILYLAITLGGVMAQKHKALAGIAIYMALNSVVSTVIQIGYFILMSAVSAVQEPSVSMVIIFLLVCTALLAGIALIIYFVIRYLLQNKLNLQ